jgi:hypothetical protein
MADWVMKGDVDYHSDKIILTGEVCERVVDVWSAIEGMFEGGLAGYSLFMQQGKYIYNPLHMLGNWKTNGTKELVQQTFGEDHRYKSIENIASENGTFFADLPQIFSFGVRSKHIHNVYPFHADMPNADRTFSLTIKVPIPPSYINRMLASYQWYLKMWDRLGDDKPDWIERIGGRSDSRLYGSRFLGGFTDDNFHTTRVAVWASD